MGKVDYKKIKVEALSGKADFDAQLKTVKEQELYAHKILDYLEKNIAEILRKRDDGASFSKEEVYSLRKLAVGAEMLINHCEVSIKRLEMMEKLSKTVNDESVEKVSFSEKRVIYSSVKDLEKICSKKILNAKNQLAQTRVDYNAEVDVSEIMEAEENLVAAYVNYCINSNSQGTVKDGFGFVEKNFDKLIDAQQGYDEQIKLSGGKILKEEFNFKK